jgi:hypothetical protein
MSGIEPKALSNEELIRYAEDMAHGAGMSKAFQLELIRRFTMLVDGAPLGATTHRADTRARKQIKLPLF